MDGGKMSLLANFAIELLCEHWMLAAVIALLVLYGLNQTPLWSGVHKFFWG